LPHVIAGPDDLPAAFAQVPARAGLTGRRLAMATWSGVFAGLIAGQLADATLKLAETWRPDLVIHEDSEQGTWLAAERLGIPHVALQATAWRGALVRLSAAPLGEHRARLGLPADPALDLWHRHGYLTTRPPALRDPADPMPIATLPIRPTADDDLGGESLAWLRDQPRVRPRIAVTLGTILPGRLGMMSAILQGLASLDVDVIATVGPGLDPADFGAHPDRIRIERYVPMSHLLPACDAVVCHAGSGTVLAAIANGLPMVLLPVSADQPENTRRCVAATIAVAVREGARTPDAIRNATAAVLGDPAYRTAAATVRSQIEAMPPPAAVLPLLERLAKRGADSSLLDG
jgi:UDP:flavonoid glycosyltransferase YjiC (YdhE family)